MSGRYFFGCAGGMLILASVAYSTFAVPSDTAAPKANPQMIEAARRALQATEAIIEAGSTSNEDIYRWSRRLAEAQGLTKEAVKEHADRMRELHNKVRAKNRAGVNGGEEHLLCATRYYVAEAEELGIR